MWLSNYFYQHSEILMSPIRVLNYFSNVDRFHKYFATRLETVEKALAEKKNDATKSPPDSIVQLRDRVRMNHDPAAFLEYYRKRWSSEKVIADITPSYYVEGRDMFARMRAAHGKVRFFFVMRNPIDRLWSGMRLGQMQDPTLDAVARLDKVLSNRGPPWQRNYVTTLMDLDAVVPSAHVKVSFFEDLFTESAISELCAFMGVEPQPAAISLPLNQSEGVQLDTERRRRLFLKLEPIYQIIHDRFGRLPDAWLADVDRFGTTSY